MEPKVCVVTLNWNRKEDTIECIESIQKMDYPNYEIVIVDNGSTDGSTDAFRERFSEITVIENERNLGYSLGFNKGIEYALSRNIPYILILNNDTIVDRRLLTECVKLAECDPKIGFVSGKVYSYHETNRLQTVGKTGSIERLIHVGAGEVDRGQYDTIREYEFLDDVFLLARKEVFEKVGMYDPNFFLYYEETDLCARVRKAGFKLMYTPHAKLWHKGSLSTGGGVNPINTYYLARNKILFLKRNASPTQFKRFLVKYSLFRFPIQLGCHIKHKQFNCIIPHMKGVVSGVIWLLKKQYL